MDSGTRDSSAQMTRSTVTAPSIAGRRQQALPELDQSRFKLKPAGLGKERVRILGEFQKYLDFYHRNFLGYQVNQNLSDVSSDLVKLLGVHTNNIGDPFKDGNLRTHTKHMERAVLAYYADLWGIRPHDERDPESAWGYVLSMGSSEGNIYGLLNARDFVSGRYLLLEPKERDSQVPQLAMAQAEPVDDNPNATAPVIFFSQDSHYSVAKSAHTLGIPTFGEVGNDPARDYRKDAMRVMGTEVWPTEVPSNRDGDINLDTLAAAVDYFAEKGHPVVIVLNLGTTFKGAYDDVAGAVRKLGEVFRSRGLYDREFTVRRGGKEETITRDGFWIHVDGALGANYVPFLAKAGIEVPEFDFRLSRPGVSSIVASGHKYPGCPWPCGVFMTRRRLQLQPPPMADYVGSPDTTFAGSRNGFSAAVLWNFLAKHSHERQTEMAKDCHDMAEYTLKRLAKKVAPKLEKRGWDPLECALTGHTLSVRFRAPDESIIRKYSLATVTVPAGGRQVKTYVHLFTMPHVTKKLIDQLISDLTRDDAFPKSAVRPIAAEALIPAQYTPVEEEAEVLHAVAMTDRGFA
ncbi:pyridoxal-dependent decarboxylase [Nocardiopsis sp. EMB25]|uniref:pyridoxal-dependent decarboxylase n=1 Tax=Nocardiopsis sp. EMB25 TaxID=2835867 RepID=UPI0022836ECF|nr:pyridoxal-dependent decarboxylase [Nocardiopsis sp. EMB25]MCY9783160.1 pyridoxal-dependent decarboxylase [Nocardiopsis sp. EMB25]